MIVYTDGSAHPNPGPGGFGVVVCDDGGNILDAYAHQQDRTTNNEQELKAILYVLIKYGKLYPTPIVYSDSSYAINTYSMWMYSWANRGWIKSDNKIPENLDLIKTYYNLCSQGYRIDLRKVPGHKGIKGNEIADKLATGKITVEEVINKYGK